ncbi:MAG TPA: M67 family metallopeptidase [Solirubrobacteraceae bacterium]|nr:M67 family metallopeptidase [Solirubrobacteraceae bacterium]
MRLRSELLEQIVEHARRDAPNECCGLVHVHDGEAVAVHEVTNLAASPFRFEMDGRQLLRHVTAFEDAGDEGGIIYHSHTRSEPYPSQTDINFARDWPGWLWLIVGLAGAEPEVRTYRIEGGAVEEVEVSSG